jgi:hypothetical protein
VGDSDRGPAQPEAAVSRRRASAPPPFPQTLRRRLKRRAWGRHFHPAGGWRAGAGPFLRRTSGSRPGGCGWPFLRRGVTCAACCARACGRAHSRGGRAHARGTRPDIQVYTRLACHCCCLDRLRPCFVPLCGACPFFRRRGRAGLGGLSRDPTLFCRRRRRRGASLTVLNGPHAIQPRLNPCGRTGATAARGRLSLSLSMFEFGILSICSHTASHGIDSLSSINFDSRGVSSSSC